jgi:hypothetical protein
MTRTLALDFSSRGMSRRPISAVPAPLLAYRSIDMRAPLLAGALISGADPATFGRSPGAGH